MLFEVAGIEIGWWVPPLAAFAVSALFSTGGVSGAFVLLPFQVSVLGFTSPAVTPTNHLFNVLAIPGGVYRYLREGRMLWPAAGAIVLGSLPGAVAGVWIRVRYLPDPAAFQLFVGLVLLCIGVHLAWSSFGKRLLLRLRGVPPTPPIPLRVTPVRVVECGWRRIRYEFGGLEHAVAVPALLALTSVVGLVGGVYGIGGGALVSPILVTLFRLPVHTIAGATLLGTLATSAFAVLFFSLLGPLFGVPGLAVAPDWLLGAMFAAGGLCGTYAGARLQRHLPQGAIRVVLAVGVLSVALRYVLGYFL